ncbi:MAG: leucine-rich repeat domain-containing protein [Promethearchaeota archaeon]
MSVRYKNKTFLMEKNYIDFFNRKVTTLRISQKKIHNIEEIIELEKLKNLEVLDLSYNQISDMRGLENLYNLKALNLQNNLIKKVSGLNTLLNLQILNLNNNMIIEIEGLDKLINLRLLKLQNNVIHEITGLDNLPILNELYLSENSIVAIDGLDYLTNLEILDLSKNSISKIEGLEKLLSLKKLDLSYNKLSQIEGLETLKNLQFLNFTANKIIEISGLSHLSNLSQLGLFKNPAEKMIKKKFGSRYYDQKGQEIVNYSREKENKKKEFITNIKKLTSVYEELSFEDIQSKVEIDLKELRVLLEEMIFTKQLNAQIKKDSIIFLKDEVQPLDISPIPLKKLGKKVKLGKKKDLNIFLSYSTLDSPYFQINDVAKSLETYPDINEVFYWEENSGENIVEYMEKTLEKCNVFILFCSENSFKSKAVSDEWQAAFQLRKKGLFKIIPVYEDEKFIPVLLTPLLNTKFSKVNFSEFIDKLHQEIVRK